MSVITLNPTTALRTETVTVSGTGLIPHISLQLLVDGKVDTYNNKFRASKEGTFTIGYLVSSSVTYGTHKLRIQSLVQNRTWTNEGSEMVLTVTRVVVPPPVEPPPVEPPVTPLVISNIYTTNLTQNSVGINWTVSDFATGYVEYGKTTSYGLLSTPELSYTYKVHIQTLSNLESGTLYHYRIQAGAQSGQKATSGDNTFTTLGTITPPPPTPTVPVAPTGLKAISGDKTAALSWEVVSLAVSYKIYRDNVAIGTSTSPSFTNTGLTNGQSYSFKVSAVNTVGEGPFSNTVSATPAASTWPWTTLQAAVNGTASGGTINATGRTFNEKVTINKPLTINGGTINASGSNVALQQGALQISNTNHVYINNMRVTGSAGSGIGVTNSSNIIFTDCEFDNNIQQGYTVNEGSSYVTLLRCHIHHNNVARTIDSGWEAGGGKVSTSDHVIFDGCEVNNNGGPGIWYDINNTAAEVLNNRVHDNDRGVFFEISDGISVHDNLIWANAHINSQWYWSAGVLISSSKNSEVFNNVIYAPGTGVGVLSQRRGSTWDVVSGNYVHDNDIVMTTNMAGNEWAGLAFAQDWAGTMETGNNREGSNRFWFPSAEPSWNRFGWWNGAQLDTLAKLNSSALSVAPSRYLTTAEKDALPKP